METKTRVAALVAAAVLLLAAIVALYALLGAKIGLDDTDTVRLPGGDQVPALLWSAGLVIVGALLALVSTPWGRRTGTRTTRRAPPAGHAGVRHG